MNTVEGCERFAIYFAPAKDAALTALADAWLGYSAWRGKTEDHPDRLGIDAGAFAHAVGKPAKYGFHATLKAPMRLAKGRRFAEFDEAVSDCARLLSPVTIERLDLQWIGSFLALAPQAPGPDLSSLAAAVVSHLDPFRAPLSKQEIARRDPDQLSDDQHRNLMTWGYPYVGAEFRFHMTLTDRISQLLKPDMRRAAEEHFATVLGKALAIDSLLVFGQANPQSRFEVLSSYPLLGKPENTHIPIGTKDLVA